SAILLFIFFPREMHPIDIAGIIIVSLGVITLAVFEKQQETAVLKSENKYIDPKYQLSVLAITFPILSALIDGVGTFADGIYLDELKLISEDSALIAYEFTFFIVALLSYLYVKFVKKESFAIFKEIDKLILINEDSAIIAYEFTFFIDALLSYLYAKFVKKQSFAIFKEKDKGFAAILETTGQFFYVFAMAGNAIIAAPLIAAHGIFS